MKRLPLFLIVLSTIVMHHAASQLTTLQSLDSACRSRAPISAWDSLYAPEPYIILSATIAELSPDGRHIAYHYIGERWPFDGIIVYDLARSAVVVVIPDAYWLHWSPDGTKLLTNAYLYNNITKETTLLPVQLEGKPHWSVDGKHIYYPDNGKWYRGNSTGGDTVFIGRFRGEDGPIDDSIFVAFKTPGDITIPQGSYNRHNIYSGRDSLVAVPDFQNVFNILFTALSPDRRYMTADFYEFGRNIMNGKQYLGLFDLKTNRLRRVLPSQGYGTLYFPSFTHRGTLLVSYACRLDSTCCVWEIDTNGVFLRRLIGPDEMEGKLSPVEGVPPAQEHMIAAVYPHPGRSRLTVRIVPAWRDHLRIQLTDMTGRLVRSAEAAAFKASEPIRVELPVQDLPSGFYLLRLQGNRGRAIQRSVIIE